MPKQPKHYFDYNGHHCTVRSPSLDTLNGVVQLSEAKARITGDVGVVVVQNPRVQETIKQMWYERIATEYMN